MKIIGITGGTGFVGTYLRERLIAAGYKVIVFSRSKNGNQDNLEFAQWDAVKRTIDKEALKKLDGIVHLAGAGIADKRWTEERKQIILKSRTEATDFLVESLQENAPNCKVFVAASAIGYYGADKGSKSFVESDEPGNDFLADVCAQWEAASQKASAFARIVIFRVGIVLGSGGGAFPQLAGSMKFGAMPILGTGKQMVSWVQICDLVCMMKTALKDEAYSGIYNAVSPQPVSNKAMMEAIAKAKGGLKIPFHVPAFLLRIIMGESGIEVLKSCTVSCKKLAEAGFVFQYPTIEMAIDKILTNKS
ncbi:MAG: TIGR01777 family oxidoreductase [Chitinophagaceae bacterium]